jgi:hypothetical protein
VNQPSTPAKSPLSHRWTADKLAAQDRKSVELIRDRALERGVADLAELCERDLALRPMAKRKVARTTESRHSPVDIVTGYHFVCDRERGVTNAGDGRFWSGSWVVAEANVPKSIQRGAYLALHETKSQTSYKQGRIVDFRRSPRDMVPENDAGGPPQIEEGIEFLVEETKEPYEWVGGGAGEKGYRWTNASAEDNSASNAKNPSGSKG